MPSARDIRRRIKSVKNIQQITNAMKMVAAARLKKAQEKALASRPYTDKIREVLHNVAGNISAGETNPLLEVREPNRTGYVLVSADKGLAGAYSSNLIREVLPHVQRGKDDIYLVTVGRKMRDYFKRRDYTIGEEYTGFSENPAYYHAQMIAKFIAKKFTSGENPYDEIYLAYTQFFSPTNLKPTIIKLLPLNELISNTKDAGEKAEIDYIFEPSAQAVLDLLLPKYLETVIYNALLQSAASELGARMAAMGAATENAKELMAKLTLHYNKVRQAAITKEISEIVGGAEALK